MKQFPKVSLDQKSVVIWGVMPETFFLKKLIVPPAVSPYENHQMVFVCVFVYLFVLFNFNLRREIGGPLPPWFCFCCCCECIETDRRVQVLLLLFHFVTRKLLGYTE